jgi:hypothetical protein
MATVQWHSGDFGVTCCSVKIPHRATISKIEGVLFCLLVCTAGAFVNPPDVWVQLLLELLRNAACRQALLKRSAAAAADPAELMLVQLAATLAEELSADWPESG